MNCSFKATCHLRLTKARRSGISTYYQADDGVVQHLVRVSSNFHHLEQPIDKEVIKPVYKVIRIEVISSRRDLPSSAVVSFWTRQTSYISMAAGKRSLASMGCSKLVPE
jgi:hypothetical protein